MPQFCTRCGQQLEADAAFCVSCGNEVRAAPSGAPPNRAPEVLQRGRRAMGVYLTAGVVFALVAAGIAEFALPGRPLTGWVAAHVLGPFGAGESTGETLYMVSKDGRWGYIDNSGNEVVPFRFDQPPPRTVTTGRGEQLVYPRLTIREHPPYPVYTGGRWSLVDRRGSPVGDHRFDEFGFTSGPILCGSNWGTWGCVDKAGNPAVDFGYDDIGGGNQGLLTVKRDGKWGLVDYKGAIIVSPIFDRAAYFSATSQVAVVKFSDGMMGLIDRKGIEVSTRRYKEASAADGGVWPVKIDSGQWGLADYRGVITRAFDSDISYVGSPAEGLIPINSMSGKRFINLKGEPVAKLPQGFPMPYGMREGRAIVGWHGSYGHVRTDGEVVVPPVFESSTTFVGGAALAQFEGSTWLVDRDGRVIWPKGVIDWPPRKAEMAAVTPWRWEMIRSQGKPASGLFLETNGTKIRVQMQGVQGLESPRERDFDVGDTPGKLKWPPDTRVHAWVFADRMVWVNEDGIGEVTMLRRAGASHYTSVSKSK